MQNKNVVALAAALLLAAGCSSQQSANQTGPSSPPALRNPLNFPLYAGASVVSSRAFTQNVQLGNAAGGHSVFTGGSGTYSGHEVIAASNASFGQLSSWVEHLAGSPPSGYRSVETGSNPQAQTQAQRYGLDYAGFERQQGTQKHGVLVIVMDPARVNERFGRILGLIGKYRALPQMMRAPIDNEAKARIGMTITQATQPQSPIGATLAALDQFEHRNARGIVVIDAVKQ